MDQVAPASPLPWLDADWIAANICSSSAPFGQEGSLPWQMSPKHWLLGPLQGLHLTRL